MKNLEGFLYTECFTGWATRGIFELGAGSKDLVDCGNGKSMPVVFIFEVVGSVVLLDGFEPAAARSIGDVGEKVDPFVE